jgi:hypothetical protein
MATQRKTAGKNDSVVLPCQLFCTVQCIRLRPAFYKMISVLCVTVKTTEELSNKCTAVDIALNLARGTGNPLY